MRKLLVFLLTIITILALVGCGKELAKPDGKLQVVTSFNAMTEFVKAVGGDKVEIHTIIPDGTEPHDFELKADDVKAIAKAQVLVYNGLNMEPWIDSAVQSAANKKLISVEASHGVQALKADPEEGHGDLDPHAWLSLNNAVLEVQNIEAGLEKADPANADYYKKNAEAYIAKLQALNDEYKGKFQNLDRHEFVTGHEAFGYLCRDYGLKQESVEDMFAEGEPNAAQLAKLVEFAKAHKIGVIFAEEMASPEVSKTLANEVGAKVETLYTMEGAEDGLSYLDRMSQNLEKIYASLR